MAHTKTAKAPTLKRTPRTLAGDLPPASANGRAHTLALYEEALQLMQAGKYDKAQAAFNAMLAGSPPDLAASIRMYINACLLQINKGQTSFTSHEERYDYAISLLNEGLYDDAREQFKQILDENPTADYAFYGLAVLASMTGDSHTCLEHLTEAIRQNPRNRIQARSDSDFQDMADDPRFTELLYPES
ncbi:MAG: tetratricopeptide repeat protein [Granulicella sp.]